MTFYYWTPYFLSIISDGCSNIYVIESIFYSLMCFILIFGYLLQNMILHIRNFFRINFSNFLTTKTSSNVRSSSEYTLKLREENFLHYCIRLHINNISFGNGYHLYKKIIGHVYFSYLGIQYTFTSFCKL